MTQLVQISDLPLSEFSEAVSRSDISISELRAAIELFTHKIAVEQYGKDVVEAGAPAWEAAILRARDDGDMSQVESVERIAHLALVLLGRFEPDDRILFLSPSRVAAMAIDALPLTFDEVSSLVPVANLAEVGFENLRSLRDVKRIMAPTVKTFTAASAQDDQIDRWSAVLPLVP
jgi:hypothetical protein